MDTIFLFSLLIHWLGAITFRHKWRSIVGWAKGNSILTVLEKCYTPLMAVK